VIQVASAGEAIRGSGVAPWLQLPISRRMRNLAWARLATLAGASLLASTARAQDTTPPTLGATDFTLTLARSDGTLLSADDLNTYFSQARCACPTNLTAGLAIGSDAAANLDTHTVDAQLMVGNDCDNVQATACVAVGSVVTLSSAQTATSTSVTTSAIFDAGGAASCGGVTTSTRFWAIVRLDGTRLTTEPSLAITLGGAGPAPPTNVQTTSADEGLLVTWTPSGDSTTLQGHQVLCSPGPATPSTAAYDLCGTAATDGGAGLFGAFDPAFVCSGLVAAGTNSTRVHGLQNGSVYQVAVVAVGIDGTPSAPSMMAAGTPAPTVGFGDLYKQAGGTGATGCAVGGGTGGAGGILIVAGAAASVLRARGRRGRRRRRAWPATALLGAAVVLASAGRARAESSILDDVSASSSPVPAPRGWNLELRFGPYRPDVDSEFANRGQSARPYEQIFSSSRHLMMQLEIDRQISHRAGTWAVGVGAGYFSVNAAALSGDLQSRSGDETGLRLVPLSASLVYRAEGLRRRFGSPVVPYAKAGLDCTLWRITDTSEPNIDGRTFGWHAAAGITFDLTSLDAESAETLARESGVHQLALFGEATLYRLDGFGSGSALHVGDTTWFAGLMLEL
jgi:hypothetical protein